MSTDEADQAAAAVKIQAIQRGNKERAEVLEIKQQTQAATKIQAIQRGNKDRAEVRTKQGDAAPSTTTKKKKKKKKKKRKRLGIAILGPPGVGKTVHAQSIAKHYDGVYIGTLEDVYDWSIAEKKGASEDIAKARAAGTPVDDSTAAHAVGERLAEDDVHKAPAWVVEGFPQTSGQMTELLLLAGGKKSPVTRIISLTGSPDVLVRNLNKRQNEEKEAGKDDLPAVPEQPALAVMCNNYDKSYSNIQQFVKDNEAAKVTQLEIKDVSKPSEEIFLMIRSYLGQTAEEEEAAAKIQAIQRGKKERAELKARQEAAVKIQARIRGKEARDHANRRVEIQENHDEDEILTALTKASSGDDGSKITGCFPKKDTKDVLLTLLLKKIGKLKSKNTDVVALQGVLNRPKVVQLMTRDFNRKDKKNNVVLNLKEFKAMVTGHGGQMKERKAALNKTQIAAIQKEFDLRPGAFKELFDDMDVNRDGGVDLDEFREAFAERAELWGYGEAFSASRTKEIGMFEAIDEDKDNIISWKEFEAYMTTEKNRKQQENSKRAQTAEAVSKKKDQKDRLAEAQAVSEQAAMEDDEECEIENLRNRISGKNNAANNIDGGAVTENVRRQKNRKKVTVSDSVAQGNSSDRRGKGRRGQHLKPARRVESGTG